MIILGLTGSIGMGKSTTAQMFRDAGAPVHDADASVHALYAGKAAPLVEIAFPGTVIDGVVDRGKLGACVIGNPEAMKKLESIIHPLVAEERNAFLASAEQSGAAVVVLDIPLLYETGGEKHCDYVAVVTTSPDEQKRRVLAREGMTSEKFDKILASQVPDSIKRQRADFIIETTDGLEVARKQVMEVLQKLDKGKSDHA
jgi:dephospho-CoA kinase